MTTATLALENGEVFCGKAFGAAADTVFELVFNTSMMGYQEIITDPSYAGQAVLFTTPHIGNVGINPDDDQADSPHVAGVVVRSLSPVVSNWRATGTLAGWLEKYGVPGIAGVDTRYLTRKLRDTGTMKGALSTTGAPGGELVERARAWPGLDGRDMVREVTCSEPYVWVEKDKPGYLGSAGERRTPPLRVALYDYGAKRNIMRHLAAWGAEVMVFPADTPAAQVLAMHPDGVVLSNGPGDPGGLPYAVEAVQQLIRVDVPIFGICLGHQLIGLAIGGKTGRLKFGHHGGNHPVLDLRTKKALVTCQNHNFTVLPDSLQPERAEVTHQSLNDGSVEGLRLKNHPVFSVQFHPEAAPGPHDGHPLFADFFAMMTAGKPGNIREEI